MYTALTEAQHERDVQALATPHAQPLEGAHLTSPLLTLRQSSSMLGHGVVASASATQSSH